MYKEHIPIGQHLVETPPARFSHYFSTEATVATVVPVYPFNTHDCEVADTMHEKIDILVDGSGDGHSVALFSDDEVYFSYERGASNNEAEFNAVILALEHLPEHGHARISTDSQVVVWNLTLKNRIRQPSFMRKSVIIQDMIVRKNLKVDIQWIPRKQNSADRLLKHYIASLCGAGGGEPLYHRVRRLESENMRLKAKLKKAMKMLESRPAAVRDMGIGLEMAVSGLFQDTG